MRRLWIVLLLMAGLVVPVEAQAPTATFETLTVGATAVGLDDSTLNPTDLPARGKCFFSLEQAEIRWRVDGTDPSTTVGHVLAAGAAVMISGKYDVTRFRAIRTGGTSGVLSVSCW